MHNAHFLIFNKNSHTSTNINCILFNIDKSISTACCKMVKMKTPPLNKSSGNVCVRMLSSHMNGSIFFTDEHFDTMMTWKLALFVPSTMRYQIMFEGKWWSTDITMKFLFFGMRGLMRLQMGGGNKAANAQATRVWSLIDRGVSCTNMSLQRRIANERHATATITFDRFLIVMAAKVISHDRRTRTGVAADVADGSDGWWRRWRMWRLRRRWRLWWLWRRWRPRRRFITRQWTVSRWCLYDGRRPSTFHNRMLFDQVQS